MKIGYMLKRLFGKPDKLPDVPQTTTLHAYSWALVFKTGDVFVMRRNRNELLKVHNEYKGYNKLYIRRVYIGQPGIEGLPMQYPAKEEVLSPKMTDSEQTRQHLPLVYLHSQNGPLAPKCETFSQFIGKEKRNNEI